MKLVMLWLATLALAAVTAASCSVNHRSGDFACQTTADCADGRLCVDSLCVSNAPIDGGGGGNDGGSNSACPSICTSCDPGAKLCKIDCSQSNGCKFPVACPAGWTCDIECNTDGSCLSGITCSDKQCQVECTGKNSCRNITCGTGACTLDCAGNDSCHTVRGSSGPETLNCLGSGSCNDVVCGSGRCDVECAGTDSCATPNCGNACACDIQCEPGADCTKLTCSHKNTCGDGFDCFSDEPGCNTCPANT